MYKTAFLQPSFSWSQAILKKQFSLIQIDHYDARSWWGKGAALGKLGKYDEALKALDESLRLNPYDAEARNNKGYALYDLGKYGDAIAAYDEALRLDPNFVAAKRNKGLALERLGQRAETTVFSDPWMNSQQRASVTGHTYHGTRAPSSSNGVIGTVGGNYLANLDIKVYHYSSCAWAQKILPENRIWFSDPNSARSAGYRACEKCNPQQVQLRESVSWPRPPIGFRSQFSSVSPDFDPALFVTRDEFQWDYEDLLTSPLFVKIDFPITINSLDNGI